MGRAKVASQTTTAPRWPLVMILLGVILQAAVQGTLTSTIRPVDSLLFTALSFGLTTLVFLPLSWPLGRHQQRSRRGARVTSTGHLRLMIAMNVATAATFVSFYLSLSLIEAATASALETAVGPVALIALSPLLLGRATPLGSSRRVMTALLVMLGFTLAWHTLTLTPRDHIATEVLAGVTLATMAGIGMAAVSLLSRRFGDIDVNPVTVTAHRFHLTYLLATILWLSSTPDAPSSAKLLSYAALGVVAVTIPLFLLQVGFQRADPLAGITIVVALPGMTYLVQLLNGAPAQPVTLVLLCAIMLAAFAQSSRPIPA